MFARRSKICNNVWHGKTLVETQLKQGTIILAGKRVYFHAAVAKAVGVDRKVSRRSFGIIFDLLQSPKNKAITYRVDYVVAAA